MSNLVEVLEVVPEDRDGGLTGWALDRPAPGGDAAPDGTFAMPLSGWALGGPAPLVAIDVMAEGVSMLRARLEHDHAGARAAHPDAPGVERAGFDAVVNTAVLPSEFELELRAVREDRSSTALATVRGRHRPLRTGREPRLRPLVLTTLGRSGSTVAMRMLAAHPQVAGGEAFRYGPRVASYWASVFQELSDPGSYPRQIAGGMRRGLNERGWWMRSADHPLMEVPDAYVREWIGVEAVESLAGFVQERIESLYEQIAANEYRPFAEYFVEKYQPNLVPSMMWELYPDAREVVLVRDFRDTLCSILAFNEKRGAVMFGRERAESDEEFVRRTFRKSAMSLMHAWRRRAGRAYLLRYEDLMSEPEATIASVVDYLGVDSSAAALDSMLAMVVERSEQTDVHRTSAGGDASVGRWRADLPVPLQEATQEAIGPALEAFGYDPAPSPA